MKCQICSNEKLHKFLSLGNLPPSDGFLNENELNKTEVTCPINIFFCDNCKLVQLGHAVNPKLLFTDSFVYTTGSSGELVKNFSVLAEKLTEEFSLSSKDLVVDIGSNDGTLLENFMKSDIKVLGVDPSKAAKLALKKNIPTLFEFFNEETTQKILKENGKAKIITATNVFAHVKELDSFMQGIKLLLEDKGVFVEESHYLKNMVSEIEYDSIYAEHLRYYSLKPLIYLFEKFGMTVFDAEKISTHGGSLRVYACIKGNFPVSENVSRIIEEEEKAGLYSKKTFDDFSKRVSENREKLRNLLFKLKKEGNHIVGLGAPAKGNTLLNFCGIGNDTLDYLAEKQNLKIGKFSPGMHIKVVEESQVFSDQPEYALLLAWNLKNIIIPKLKEKGFKGKIIVPIPEPAIF
ncbi:class I SAM-dependent methyltransferase [Candidatus Micrarchaeota archaeon]|nr:class I SAM-dependent methyltransferase [Candidatus Micrarchaeota archaeon]MBU2476457.1 class I SAM-dependent methyltransferase [Candidatus Micrarchaeota archaeon]